MPKIYKFKATLQRPDGVGTWHYVDTPIQVEKEFGVKGKLPVCGKVNGVAFTSTLMPRGNGEHYLVLDKSIRTQANIELGGSVELEISKDISKREVSLPADFKESLLTNQRANAYFESLAYSHKKAYVGWVNDAKKDAARQRRIEKAVNLLAEKKKLR